ncbi:MAG: hypothetical protein VX961_07845, partial [Verrucomicrobiota bacterium]|nr:hypothetical protein [Verrucomicrobiota bacterium]
EEVLGVFVLFFDIVSIDSSVLNQDETIVQPVTKNRMERNIHMIPILTQQLTIGRVHCGIGTSTSLKTNEEIQCWRNRLWVGGWSAYRLN